MENIASQIINWIKTYAENARVKGLVIGVSGGVDSAVVSTLCARTGLPTLCLEMPIHQAESHVSRAEEHIEFLKAHYPNVNNLKVDLTPVFDQFVTEIPPTDKSTYEMALANTRARLRMTTLYYFAGLESYIVVGTGNKIEDFGVGFFTKYGDGGVDISPIADLMKSEVYKLAEYLHIPKAFSKQNLPTDSLATTAAMKTSSKPLTMSLNGQCYKPSKVKKLRNLVVESVKYSRYTPASTVLTNTKCNPYHIVRLANEKISK